MWPLPPFRDLDLTAVTELSQAGTWVDVPPGREVASPGNADDTVFIVLTGQLEMLLDGRRVATLRTGESFGAEMAPADAPRAATVRTLTPVRAFGVPRDVVDRLLRPRLDPRPRIGRGQAHTSAPHTWKQT
jgi:CRP-like cAMP-binding protein